MSFFSHLGILLVKYLPSSWQNVVTVHQGGGGWPVHLLAWCLGIQRRNLRHPQEKLLIRQWNLHEAFFKDGFLSLKPSYRMIFLQREQFDRLQDNMVKILKCIFAVLFVSLFDLISAFCHDYFGMAFLPRSWRASNCTLLFWIIAL